MPSWTRRRSRALGLTALLSTIFTIASAATLQAQVLTDPRIAEFNPSPDHWVVLNNGEQAVLRYELGVCVLGASVPFATVDMGKPSPGADGKIRYDFSALVAAWPLPGGGYEARVSAVGPQGAALSNPSNPFTFTGGLENDILWRHATRGEVWAWPMDGAAQTQVGTVADAGYKIVGVADYTGDGKADILWHHATRGDVWVWQMDGTTRLSESWAGTLTDTGYRIVGTGDYDGDGQADILWHHATRGEVWVWPMDAVTGRRSETWVATVPDTGYRIVGTGDFNRDGRADILWHHATRGEVWVWLMNGATRLKEALVGTVPDVGYQIVGVADYTADGKADILWHHATRGDVWVWRMDGTTRLSESWAGTLLDTGYRIVGTGDYDGDGQADILWHHATRGEVWVWPMDAVTGRRSETWVATVPDVGYQIIKMK